MPLHGKRRLLTACDLPGVVYGAYDPFDETAILSCNRGDWGKYISMKSKYREWILPIIVLAILLAFTPHALYRVIKTGNPYLFTSDFFGDMLARLHGPGRFRFILQPTVAMLLGIRDGRKDAREGASPFLWALVFHKELRPQLLKHMLASVRNLVSIAILLDLISQYLIFRLLRPGAALILGPVLIAAPYSCARALSNRIARRRG